LAILSMNY